MRYARNVDINSFTFQYLSFSKELNLCLAFMISSLNLQYLELFSSSPREFRLFRTQPRNEYGYDRAYANSIRSDEHVNTDEYIGHGSHRDGGYVNVNGRLWRL